MAQTTSCLWLFSLFNNEEPVLFPDLAYGFHKVWADLYHINHHEIPLNENFEMEDDITDNGGIVITNPNASTGIYKPLKEIGVIVRANHDVVVIIDEAYISFGGETALSLLAKYNNVLITRTLSKDAALAWLWVSYGMGSPKLISVINVVKNAINPYNVDRVTETVAVAAVQSWSYYEELCAKIFETRDLFSAELTTIGFEVLSTLTNFVLAESKIGTAAQLFSHLESKNIYVRYFPKVD